MFNVSYRCVHQVQQMIQWVKGSSFKAEWRVLRDKSQYTDPHNWLMMGSRANSVTSLDLTPETSGGHQCKGNFTGRNSQINCPCHQRSLPASGKGCWHWLSWNHPWRSQRYSGALSASHHPVRKESKFTNTCRVICCSKGEAGWVMTLEYSCKISNYTNTKFL